MSMEKCPVCGNLVFTNDNRAKSDEFEALADIRRWACETLDVSDAGRLCGMLSEVSRHANGLKAENEKLRELVEDAVEAASLDDVRDWSIGHRLRLIRQAKELGIETDDV